MRVVILLNREEDLQGRLAIFTRSIGEPRYVRGDKLELVYQYEDSRLTADWTPEEELEVVFAMFNRGSGKFVGDDLYPQRSLSCGDVVGIDGVAYSCESVGWVRVAQEVAA